MPFFIIVFFAAFGAILASFLEVAAERFANQESLGGRSHCPQCGKTLGFFELVPIASWLFLGGRCSTCKKPIPVRHLVGEITVAVLCGGFAYVTLPMLLSGDPFLIASIALQFIVVAALVLAFFADMRFTIIPDESVIAIVLASALLIVLRYVVPQGTFGSGPLIPSVLSAIVGAALAVGLLGSFTLVSRGAWMGLGDVKLALAFGLFFGAPLILFVLGASFIVGAVVGLGLIMMQGKSLKSTMPFGPALVIAALLFIFLPSHTISRLLEFFFLSTML